ncbi:hypothetical protein SARC_04173 [Sphaeroforma arctica JP610]|uniref:PDZ domain-containing protein n=1 Tax=Sphaeroforma arctica JP610 TaxID=667725 RepID=A0A0L0G415_9EUKA|nr:hypothetical protein SARC_04173 [Sphaeroforma arctica JP610]KNC83589.1 hypothetical protein SARC_04173 [Sphaeroforma arctica JP610]|eukprot:XP_014157491.1 hypothetical protein SARC_04173 [Sphaeroforma arctica JP610]
MDLVASATACPHLEFINNCTRSNHEANTTSGKSDLLNGDGKLERELSLTRRVSGGDVNERSRDSPKISVSGTWRPVGDKTRARSNTAKLLRQARPKSTDSEMVASRMGGSATPETTKFEEVPLFKQAQTSRPRILPSMLSMDALPVNLKSVTEGFVKSTDIHTSRHTPGHHLSAGRTSGAVVDIAWSIEEAKHLGQAQMHFPHGFTVTTCHNGNVYVSGVWANWPAFIAGLRFGDQILKINDVRVQGLRPAQVYELLAASDAHVLRIKSHPFEHTVTVERRENPETGALEILGITFLKGNILKVLPGTAVARSGFTFTDHYIIAVNDDIVLGLPDKLIMQKFKETGSVVSVTVVHKTHFLEIIGTCASSLDLLRRSALVDVMVGYCRSLSPGGLQYYSAREDDDKTEIAVVQGATSLVSSLQNTADTIGADTRLPPRKQQQYQDPQSQQYNPPATKHTQPEGGIARARSPAIQNSSRSNSPPPFHRRMQNGLLKTASTTNLATFKSPMEFSTTITASGIGRKTSLAQRVSLQNFTSTVNKGGTSQYVRENTSVMGLMSPNAGMREVQVQVSSATGHYGAPSPRNKSTYAPIKTSRRRLQRSSSSLSIQGFHEV